MAALAKLGEDCMLGAQAEVGELILAAGGGSSTMPQKQQPGASRGDRQPVPACRGARRGDDTGTVASPTTRWCRMDAGVARVATDLHGLWPCTAVVHCPGDSAESLTRSGCVRIWKDNWV